MPESSSSLTIAVSPESPYVPPSAHFDPSATNCIPIAFLRAEHAPIFVIIFTVKLPLALFYDLVERFFGAVRKIQLAVLNILGVEAIVPIEAHAPSL